MLWSKFVMNCHFQRLRIRLLRVPNCLLLWITFNNVSRHTCNFIFSEKIEVPKVYLKIEFRGNTLCSGTEIVILGQDSGFVVCSANYTYWFCRTLHKEKRRGIATFKGRWLWDRTQLIRTRADRTTYVISLTSVLFILIVHSFDRLQEALQTRSL